MPFVFFFCCFLFCYVITEKKLYISPQYYIEKTNPFH